MSSNKIANCNIVKYNGISHNNVNDVLAVEEPLEIRLHGESIVVTMRTPGDDVALAAGFLFTEGIINNSDDIGSISYCSNTTDPSLNNIVNVLSTNGVKFDREHLNRNFYSNSSCGLCGKATIESIKAISQPIQSVLRISASVLNILPDAMRLAQYVFDKTGGLHAASLFDEYGNLIAMREDVGRHNAVDKVIGEMLLKDKLPLDRHILFVSGRASFEIMQKALTARIPVVAAASAPSSLAVQFAEEFSMTLVGFLRDKRFNAYTGNNRVGL